MTEERQYRPLTGDEIELIARVIEIDTAIPIGRAREIAAQHRGVYDEDYTTYDRLLYLSSEQQFADLEGCRYPIEAEYKDEGIPVMVMLFHEALRLKDLETIRPDGRPLTSYPPALDELRPTSAILRGSRARD